MDEEVGASAGTISHILCSHGFKPYLTNTFKLSMDKNG
jgi:hypothetical protein